MRTTFSLSAALLATAAPAFLSAQAPANQAPASQAPATPTSANQQQPVQEKAYVRRISASISAGAVFRPLIRGTEERVNTSNPAVEALYRTTNESKLLGYGGGVQLALTDRFAVHATFLLRRVGYVMLDDIHEGVDNPTTIADERRYRAREETTRARYLDIPLLVRYYGKSRFDPGTRWFLQGGGALRKVRSVGSSIKTTTGSETFCCDTTAITPSHRTVRGFVVGAGLQAIDPVGIRLVPEFRFTRWTNDPFTGRTLSTPRNQYEFLFSFSF
jgi:hypothetical protein